MARALAHSLVRGLLALTLCASLFGAFPAFAQSQVDLADLRNRMAALNDRLLNDPQVRNLRLSSLLEEIGLPSPVAAEDVPLPPLDLAQYQPARSEVQNLRLALAILAQSHSGKDNGDVTLAQGARGLDALTFRGGRVTLADIREGLVRHGLPPLQLGSDGAWRLDAPVILWEDTVLSLGPQDRVLMSRPGGAFLLSFGLIRIDGSKLGVYGDENTGAPDFSPFLAVGGGGALQMKGAEVSGLGFGPTGKFSGVAIAAHPLMRPVGKSILTGNVFHDMQTLAITGSAGVEVVGNRFFDMRHNSLLFSGAPLSRAAGNLFYGQSVTNAIRVLNGSSDTTIEGNYVMGGDRAAIIIEGNSARVMVRANVMANRSGGGIKFFRTHCGTATGNVVLDMRQKGVEVRTSRDTTVSANLIAGNRSAGIWISAQPKGAVTHVSDNVLLSNDAGINTATGGTLFLEGNDFSDQFPRLVKGDIAQQNGVFVRDLRGVTPVRMTSGTLAEVAAQPFSCNAGFGQ